MRLRALVCVSLGAVGGLALAGPAQAAFPGLNGKVAFVRSDVGNAPPRGAAPGRGLIFLCVRGGSAIWTINPDGGGATDIGTASNCDGRPAWSADGKRLAFSRVDSSSGFFQIWVMNQDGTGAHNISHSSANDGSPAWSPDGTKIVFSRFNGSEFELWVMNSDGSDQHRLVAPPTNGSDNNPAWSPDGTKIAFARYLSSAQIYVVNADGSGTPANVSNNADYDTAPNWAPDGSRLTFSKFPGGTDANNSEIWVMAADGSSPKSLTPEGSASRPEGADNDAPVFSPDGTQIAFQRRANGNDTSFVYVMSSSDGSGRHSLTSPTSNRTDFEPDWQPLANVVTAAQIPPCSTTGTVTVAVGDTTGFKSPPRGVHYRLDFGAEQVATTDGGTTATIPVPAGRHELEYWGQNQAGDQEAVHHNVVVTVDQTKPTVAILRDQARFTFRRGQFASVTIRASDVGGAGLVRNPSRRRLRVSTSSLGTRTVRATAVDACGNTATALLRYRVVRAAVAHRRVVRPRFTG